ncbi:MAG: PLP-dependent aminotransferase family protein [Acidimicrobiia bacterium]|nr:PLP-dependent aminotransferase family protein [Acidimicrobiia bacterium]
MPFDLAPPPFDATSNIPVYRQIGNWIRNQISTGRIQPGEQLPTTRELSKTCGVGRMIVISAYQLLESEGLINGRVGRGSFVTTNSTPVPVSEQPRRVWENIASSSAAPMLPMPASKIAYRFDSSRPSEDLFPLEEFREAVNKVLADDAGASQVLQLGSPQGLPALREIIFADAVVRGHAAKGDDILITSGCQQAMDLIERFVSSDAPAHIAIEDPVFPGVRNVFGRGRNRLIALPTDGSGIDSGASYHILQRERPTLVVVTPSFQNPTGGTMSITARENLVGITRKTGTLIVENDIYSGLRYTGEPIPTVRSLAREQTLLIGSFSKISFPGLRVGWIIGPKPAIAELTRIRHWCDLHSDQLSQAVLFQFADSGRLQAHRLKMVQHGAKRLKAVLDACANYLPKGSFWTSPKGGMSLWVELPEGADTAHALRDANAKGVHYLPGSLFAVETPAPNALRLSFAGLTPQRIDAGVKILGEIFKGYADTHFRKSNINETAMV